MVADRGSRTPFTDEDLNLLLAMAAQATVAVENMHLHNELKRANARLQEFDRLKSEFVGIVAHDFRRPLMAIRGFAELVLEEPDLPIETPQEFMRTVITETEHLALLANDTLLITQIETGQFAFNWSEIDLGPFILDAVPLGLSDHSVLMDIPAGFPKVVVDWFRGLPYWYEDEHAIYVHAGLPRGSEGFIHPRAVTDPIVLLWLRDDYFFRNYRGKLVVFGHTRTEYLPPELSGYTPEDPTDLWAGENVVGIDTGCGNGGFLTALELPAMNVYESRD